MEVGGIIFLVIAIFLLMLGPLIYWYGCKMANKVSDDDFDYVYIEETEPEMYDIRAEELEDGR